VLKFGSHIFIALSFIVNINVSLLLDIETGGGPGTGYKDRGNPYEAHKELWSDKVYFFTIYKRAFGKIQIERNGHLHWQK